MWKENTEKPAKSLQESDSLPCNSVASTSLSGAEVRQALEMTNCSESCLQKEPESSG